MLFDGEFYSTDVARVELSTQNLLMAGRESTGRQPEFTNTQYEIPSWQTPWSKPWYQRTDSKKDDRPNRFKYNDRGHLNDCTCSNCEDDLEKAFSPQSNTTRQTVSDLPKDRHREVNIQDHLKDLKIGADQKTSSFNNPQNTAPKKVFLFSDLAEVTPNTCTSIAPASSGSTSNNTSTSNTTRQECFASSSSTSEGTTHDSVMDLFDNINSIQSISEQTKDIQTRVHNFYGKSNTQEYQTMRDLLLTLKRELSRIQSNVEWFAVSRGMALDAITKTLQVLEQRAKEADKS